MEQEQEREWEGYADWRNRSAVKGRHGGLMAASFVLVVAILENLAFIANASTLGLYLTKYMHFTPSKSANDVTNFQGTAFLLALLGGFFSDAYFSPFVIFLISASIEFLGLIILTIQARTASSDAMLFVGLYVVALGMGGIKGTLPSHGAEQLDEKTPQGRRQRSSFFSYFVFCLVCGALVAVTFVAWLDENKGWEWGFGVSTIAIFVSILIFLCGSSFYRNKIPRGSPLTTIAKVLVAATVKSCVSGNSSNEVLNLMAENKEVEPEGELEHPGNPEVVPQLTNNLQFLNRAVDHNLVWLDCNIRQVEDVKIVLKLLPIFACTIMLNCCLAQLSTFSIQQAVSMDTKIGKLKVPPPSLAVFPVVFTLILTPIYDRFIIPFARRVTKTEMGVTHLQRIGVGLVLSIIGMAVAAVVEIKRKGVARDARLLDSQEALPITFLWIAPQYLFLGSADLFVLAGMLECFFTEAPSSMRSLATSLTWASVAMGYYLSSVIVTIVNNITGSSGNTPWLRGSSINLYKLDYFYWLLCGFSAANFLHYLFWAMRYQYRSVG